MEDSRTLVTLLFVFVPLSLVSIGGGPAVFAEMQHEAVVVHGWVTQRQFGDLFAISRAAPGPGALLATLIGWQAAGWLGALVVSLAFFLPSSIVVYVAAHFWNRLRGSAWHSAVEDGFLPIAAGLVLAGAFELSPLAGRCDRRRAQMGGHPSRHPGLVNSGAMRYGADHGLQRLSRCWALMLLSFAVGMASLVWMIVLTLLMVLQERDGGGRAGLLMGIALLAAAGLVIAHPGWMPSLFPGAA